MLLALAIWAELGGPLLATLGFVSMGAIPALKKAKQQEFAGPAPDGSDKFAVGFLISPEELRKSRYKKFRDILMEHRDSADLTPAMRAALES